MRTFTTREAARRIGISRQGLYLAMRTWLRRAGVEIPVTRIGKLSFRRWTRVDIALAKRLRPKSLSGCRPTKARATTTALTVSVSRDFKIRRK